MDKGQDSLSRRERQILNILYKLGTATAAEVQTLLPGDPSYSTERTFESLKKSGSSVTRKTAFVMYSACCGTRDGQPLRHTWPARHVLRSSAERMVATLLDSESSRLTKDELNRLAKLVSNARKERKAP